VYCDYFEVMVRPGSEATEARMVLTDCLGFLFVVNIYSLYNKTRSRPSFVVSYPMVREYRWRLAVRSYEGDAWGFAPTSAILRYFEQSAVAAAADLGYGSEYHREHNSAWVVRRMSVVMHSPARQGDELEIATWISHFAKVRGGREYKLLNAVTGELLYSGYT